MEGVRINGKIRLSSCDQNPVKELKVGNGTDGQPPAETDRQIDERCQLTARSVEARSEARNPAPLEISRVDPVNENDSGLGYLVERSDAWKDHRRDFRCLPERSMVRKLRSLLLVRGGSCLQVVGELVELG